MTLWKNAAEIADTLDKGVYADIWLDTQSFEDEGAGKQIAEVQRAMSEAAELLRTPHKEAQLGFTSFQLQKCHAKAVIDQLLSASINFVITPLPDVEYELEVKDDVAHFVQPIVDACVTADKSMPEVVADVIEQYSSLALDDSDDAQLLETEMVKALYARAKDY